MRGDELVSMIASSGFKHSGAGGLSFADGHSEIKKWRAASTRQPVRKTTSDFPVPVGGDMRDIEWLAQRTTCR